MNGSQVFSIVDKLTDHADAGIAAAMSMAAIPQPTQPGMWSFGGGIGIWRGQTGYSLGLGKMTDDGRWTFRAAASLDEHGSGGGSVGFGIQF